MIFVALYVELR